MTNPISGAGHFGQPHIHAAPQNAPQSFAVGGSDFQARLQQSLQAGPSNGQIARENVESSRGILEVANTEVLTSAQKADLALRMMEDIRGKVLEAYREVQQLRM